MNKKMQLILLAGELCSLGKAVEKKRAELKKLIDAGKLYDAPEVLTALREFQKADEKWKQTETSYLKLRKELEGK